MFLPSHIARVMDMLERIPEPQDIPLHVDLDDINESQSIIDSEGASEIRAMIQNLQQQMEQQKQEHKEVHAQLQQERREWSEREERLRAQFEQEKKEAQERLTAQLEGFAQTLNPKTANEFHMSSKLATAFRISDSALSPVRYCAC
ncbi:hypothetical protein APSETT444_009332 [Aspergillus pseudonomiae]